jgi:flotillin
LAAVPLTGTTLLLSLVLGTLGFWFLRSFLCICKPNEVLVLSGRKWRNADGQEVGYRVIAGGRAIRIPILEDERRLKVSTMPVSVEVKNAYAKGGTPLHIQAIANIKISSEPGVVGNAIERFLDCKPTEIARVAKETLEGHLRGVVAALTPEQVNEDRLQFSDRIEADVRRDLIKLGLELDTFKIQSVSDEMNYLNSIGRKQIALIIRDAEIAESDALGEAQRIEASSEQDAQVAKTQNQIAILEQENDLRKVKAQLEQRAKSEEEVTIATAREKRAKFEQTLQTTRAELERLRLEADQVLPAEAQRQAQALNARGAAASYEENAKAAALVNEILGQVWLESGSATTELFLIQKLESILQQSIKVPAKLHLRDIHVVDNGDGKALTNLVQVYPDILLQFLGSLKDTLGLDIVGVLTSPTASNGSGNGHAPASKTMDVAPIES